MIERVPLVVIIPTRNRFNSLRRAIESVLSQSYPLFRLVVVNDGSEDSTATYLNSLHDPRITEIHFDNGQGVNVARNAALQTLKAEEWALFLDDDDTLLPNALQMICIELASTDYEICFFNTILREPLGETIGGYQFRGNETRHDSSYQGFMLKENRKGDSVPVMKADLFIKKGYKFSEDVNGFESELFSLMARDGVKMCFLKGSVTRVDRMQPEGHLSHSAARNDPASFVRANLRIFHDHRDFFAQYPRESMKRAIAAIKIAWRAYDPLHAVLFFYYYLQGAARLVFRKGKEQE